MRALCPCKRCLRVRARKDAVLSPERRKVARDILRMLGRDTVRDGRTTPLAVTHSVNL